MMHQAVLPNFFIVGAAKAGTTSMVRYMSQHPEVFLPKIKEPKFFSVGDNKFPHRGPGAELSDSRVIKTWPEYLALFQDARDAKAIGEASVDYLFFPGVSARIKESIPSAKIIIMLRNPAHRAFSAYMHYIRDGYESLSFEEAIRAEPLRKKLNYEFFWFYREAGYYYEQVKRFLDKFGFENILFILFEDLITRPSGCVRRAFEFLGVSTEINIDTSRQFNASGKPRSRVLHKVLSTRNKITGALRSCLPSKVKRELRYHLLNLNLSKIKLDEAIYSKLMQGYRGDILRLQDMIGIDLSHWLVR